MRLDIWAGLYMATLISLSCAEQEDYGVGFELTSDYGVASVYFANGTAADIAKIQGSASYRREMRMIAENATIIIQPDHVASAPLKFFSVFAPLSDYLYSWLGPRGDSHVHSQSRMLRALKTAAESYIEAPVSYADAVYSFPAHDSAFQSLRTAASLNYLKLPLAGRPFSGIFAARTYNITGTCTPYVDGGTNDPDDPPQLILTVQYTRADLTAALLYEECGVFETKRLVHSADLGQEQRWLAQHRPMNDTIDESESSRYFDRLFSVLSNITRLPVDDDGNGADLNYINNVIVYGEAASDKLLKDVLKEVLRGSFGAGKEEGNLTQMNMVETFDPVFAASRNLAWDCWDRVNFKSHQEL